MNWDAIGAIGEISGALVVVVTLIYVAWQVRQHTTQLRIESHRATAELQIQVNRIFYNPVIAKDIHSALRDWDRSSPEARQLASQWLLDTVTHFQTLHFMFLSQTVDSGFYQAEENTLVHLTLATDGGQKWWASARPFFSTTLVERIDARISSTPTKEFAALMAVQSGVVA